MVLAIVIPVAAGVILFFLLPMLEKPRQTVLAWVGLGSKQKADQVRTQKPPYNEKLGTYIIHGIPKEQVWAAALQVLKNEKMEVAKTSESWIIARQTTGDRVEVDVAVVDHPGPPDELRPWAPAVVLSADFPAIGELGDFPSWSKAQRQAMKRHLGDKIIDLLYPTT